MDTIWIDDLLRLNARIVATQAVVNAQAFTIVEMMEAGEDTAKVEELHSTYRNELRRLRRLRDILVDEIKDGTGG